MFKRKIEIAFNMGDEKMQKMNGSSLDLTKYNIETRL